MGILLRGRAKNKTSIVAFSESVCIHYASYSNIDSLTTKEYMTKFSSANFQKMLSPSYIILKIQRLEVKQYRSR